MSVYTYVGLIEKQELKKLSGQDRTKRQLELDMRSFLVGATSLGRANDLVKSIFKVTDHKEIAQAMVEYGNLYLKSLDAD